MLNRSENHIYDLIFFQNLEIPIFQKFSKIIGFSIILSSKSLENWPPRFLNTRNFYLKIIFFIDNLTREKMTFFQKILQKWWFLRKKSKIDIHIFSWHFNEQINILLLFRAFDYPVEEFKSNFADKMVEKPIIFENFLKYRYLKVLKK